MHTEGRRRPTTTESSGNKARGDIAKRGRGDHKEQSPAPKKKRKKEATPEEQNNDQDQRGGSTHRNKRDVHGRSPPRRG
jgi:hypothetical protein